MPIYALAGGSLIFVGFWVVVVLVVAFSYYTYRGSGINAHPNDGSDGAPGAAEPSDAARPGRTPEAHEEVDAGISTHGTR